MLQTLRNISPVEAQKVLIVLTQELLPQPFDENPIYNIDPDLYRSTLRELKKQSYVQDGDTSIKARTRLLSLLSNEMSAMVLTPERKRKAISRLAQKGLLSLHNYSLEFDPKRYAFEDLAIKRSHIVNAFKFFDKYYHISDPNVPITLFSKKIDADRPEDVFILIVIASREKSMLIVRGAWRIYLSDFPDSQDYDLYPLFNIFLDRYGLLIKTPNVDWSKLILHDTIADPADNFKNILQYKDLKPEEYSAITVIKRSLVFGVYEVKFVFSINVSPYRIDLLRHGVKL